MKKVNSRRDSDGILYSRQAMIHCGLALNLNRQWEERQLAPHLHDVIRKYRDNFEGRPVNVDNDPT